MSLRTPASPKNVSLITKIQNAARGRIAQLGLAASLSVAGAVGIANIAEAQEPAVCRAPDSDCPGGTEARRGRRPRSSAPRDSAVDETPPPPPPSTDACGDSGARSPITNVDAYLRDPVVRARIERMHPGLDLSNAGVYTLSNNTSVSRMTWDEGRTEPATGSRTLSAGTRVVGVRVDDAGHYDANGRQIYLVLDLNCGDVISGVISADNAGLVRSLTSTDVARRDETSEVRDEVASDASTDADASDEGDPVDAYAPPPAHDEGLFGGIGIAAGLGGGLLGRTTTSTSTEPGTDMYSISGSCRPEMPGTATSRQICTTTVTGGSPAYDVMGGSGVEVQPSTGGSEANRTIIVSAPNEWRTITINGERQDVMVDSSGRLITREGPADGGTRTTTSHGPAVTGWAPLLELALGYQWRNGARLASYTRFGVGFTEENPFLYHISERVAVGYHPTNEIWGIDFLTGIQFDIVNTHTTPIVSVPLEAMFNLYSGTFARDAARFRFGAWAGVLIPASGNRGAGAWDVVPEGGIVLALEAR